MMCYRIFTRILCAMRTRPSFCGLMNSHHLGLYVAFRENFETALRVCVHSRLQRHQRSIRTDSESRLTTYITSQVSRTSRPSSHSAFKCLERELSMAWPTTIRPSSPARRKARTRDNCIEREVMMRRHHRVIGRESLLGRLYVYFPSRQLPARATFRFRKRRASRVPHGSRALFSTALALSSVPKLKGEM
jgi:hypothetical protein